MDVAGTTSGVPRVVGGAEDVASDMGTIEGATGVGGMISVGISACCTCYGCSSRCNSGCAGLAGAPGCAT